MDVFTVEYYVRKHVPMFCALLPKMPELNLNVVAKSKQDAIEKAREEVKRAFDNLSVIEQNSSVGAIYVGAAMALVAASGEKEK